MTLEILTSDLLDPFRHGFFTRRGGASSGVFAGLNCGFGSSDQRDIVRINRDRAAAAMAVPSDRLHSVNQVHSDRAVTITCSPLSPLPEADAMVCATPGQALAVLTADCMPVLLADPASGIIGAAHAGWRGAVSGVLESTVSAMRDLGARPDAIAAVIGPCISQSSYEVGSDMQDVMLISDPDAQRFFADGESGRLQFDLPGYGLERLRRAGVTRSVWVRHCTYADSARFYSYRRSVHRQEADYGRLISVIRL